MTGAAVPAVHVVDDEASVRDAIDFLLRMHELAVRTYASGPQLLAAFDAAADASAPLRGCLLLDVRMDPMSGLQLHDELIARDNALPVLFLSGHGDIPMAVDAMSKGALDFIEKPFRDEALVERLQRALALEAERHAARSARLAVDARFGALSPRETAVMERVATGKLNKVIADELHMAVRTVEVHRSRVFVKLGVRSAAELAALLARQRAAGG